jgi:uncharacterized protein (DUF169 family)
MTTDWRDLESRLTEAADLRRRPVAVTFLDAPPAGVPAYRGTQPSGCSFWRLAAEGRAFYTVPGDHFNCPIGSYTHGLTLPPARASELEQTLTLMAGLGYVRMEEVPAIPCLPRPPAAVVYAPLGEAPVAPDVAVLADLPGRLMLVHEAAMRAGVASGLPLLGRPTCMALPASLAHGSVLSTGCIGNRVYTDVGDDALYLVIRGRDLAQVVDALPAIARANQELAAHHRGRRQALASE